MELYLILLRINNYFRIKNINNKVRKINRKIPNLFVCGGNSIGIFKKE